MGYYFDHQEEIDQEITQEWQQVQESTMLLATKLSDFFRQSPLAEVAATGELDLSRDRSLPIDRLLL
jgi:hypothetical protein